MIPMDSIHTIFGLTLEEIRVLVRWKDEQGAVADILMALTKENRDLKRRLAIAEEAIAAAGWIGKRYRK